MKQNKGFTLIEMLVVVGMIGVLAAAVLTALGPSRQKARDTRVISGLNQIAAIAETGFNGNAYPPDLAAIKALTGGTTAVDDIKAIAGSDPTYTIGAANSATFAISSVLPSGGNYCVDSSGKRKASSTSVSGACN